MNEACLNLLGQSLASPAGQDFALRVMRHLRGLLEQFQAESGDFFNLEATPAEGTTYRLAMLDQARCPGIIQAVSGQGASFYTNSTHLPVDYSEDIFDTLDCQDQLQQQYTGGTVLHAFVGEEITDTRIVKELVRKITDNYGLPYFTLTPTFSICAEHGYLHGRQNICPHCEREAEVYSRVVGYLRPVNRWNDAKQREFGLRKTYNLEILAAEASAQDEDEEEWPAAALAEGVSGLKLWPW
jgi:ribonucleoside-triphosphate reductase